MSRHRATLGLCLAASALAQASVAQASALNARRADTIRAVGRYFQAHPGVIGRCGVGGRDTESMGGTFAFPEGRAERFYQLSYGQGFAFRMVAGQARLVWCGLYLGQPGAVASKLPGTVVPALRTPMRTLSGIWPVERGGMEVWDAFASSLTVSRLSADGRWVCHKLHDMPGALALPSPDNLRYTCP